MTLINKVEKLKKTVNRSAYTERILAQLEFATELSWQRQKAYDGVVSKAADMLIEYFERKEG